jgi:hypothetical protein
LSPGKTVPTASGDLRMARRTFVSSASSLGGHPRRKPTNVCVLPFGMNMTFAPSIVMPRARVSFTDRTTTSLDPVFSVTSTPKVARSSDG